MNGKIRFKAKTFTNAVKIFILLSIVMITDIISLKNKSDSLNYAIDQNNVESHLMTLAVCGLWDQFICTSTCDLLIFNSFNFITLFKNLPLAYFQMLTLKCSKQLLHLHL